MKNKVKQYVRYDSTKGKGVEVTSEEEIKELNKLNDSEDDGWEDALGEIGEGFGHSAFGEDD